VKASGRATSGAGSAPGAGGRTGRAGRPSSQTQTAEAASEIESMIARGEIRFDTMLEIEAP
jgi:hypothetical protein